ncbi:hypothetical protein BDZ91DRAFT_740371 [Kalaharituber pfeilii]|nr:hypothetical protein BDZ91DRAFT_740371 [Kalaharituber pfeilii]
MFSISIAGEPQQLSWFGIPHFLLRFSSPPDFRNSPVLALPILLSYLHFTLFFPFVIRISSSCTFRRFPLSPLFDGCFFGPQPALRCSHQ